MKKFDISKIMMFCVLFLAFLELTVNKFIWAGVFLIIAYSIYRNGGAGKYNEKSQYEKEADAENLTFSDLHVAFKNMNTTLGKCWVGRHKAFEGNVLVWGPTPFKDCIVLGLTSKGKAYMRCVNTMANITYPEEEKWRFDQVIDTKGFEITPKNFSEFASGKLMTTVMIDDLSKMINDLNAGKNSIPEDYNAYTMYHYNTFDGIFFDADGNAVLAADINNEDSIVAVSDMDGNEMARIVETEQKDAYKIIVDGEQYGLITKEKAKNDMYTLGTEGGVFEASNFQAVARGKLSSNYVISIDEKPVAYTGVSAQIIFDGLGKTSNVVVCSLDDDYLVLYAAFQVFLMKMYKWMR